MLNFSFILRDVHKIKKYVQTVIEDAYKSFLYRVGMSKLFCSFNVGFNGAF